MKILCEKERISSVNFPIYCSFLRKMTYIKKSFISENLYWFSECRIIYSEKNQLYKTIRDEIKTPEQSFALLRDMRKKADIYMALKSSEDELWRNNKDIRENLELLKLFNVKSCIYSNL